MSFLSIHSSAQAAIKTVIYPRPEADSDRRTEYPLKLLELALNTVNRDYMLMPSVVTLNQGRALKELSQERTVDVVWSMTSVEREKELLPIRIPIYRGLIGWRLFLAKKSNLETISAIKEPAQLKDMRILQGHDWPDTEILKANGFSVLGVVHYPAIFEMLQAGRGDLFPRSIIEIWAEAETYHDAGIVIEPNWMLRYPTAFYYFVARNNGALARDIETGLTMLVESGEFNQLFYHYYGGLLESARIPERTVIELNNPILPPDTPLGVEKFWHK
ncbi:MAG: ABC transporter substrate-binding protein [Pseudomonadales bacterium]|nr:ABC transporter substrate-binding protein [Pseudomonadales bacterium]